MVPLTFNSQVSQEMGMDEMVEVTGEEYDVLIEEQVDVVVAWLLEDEV